MKKLIILTPILSVFAVMFLASCASKPETTQTTTTTTEEVTRPAAATTTTTTHRATGGY